MAPDLRDPCLEPEIVYTRLCSDRIGRHQVRSPDVGVTRSAQVARQVFCVEKAIANAVDQRASNATAAIRHRCVGHCDCPGVDEFEQLRPLRRQLPVFGVDTAARACCAASSLRRCKQRSKVHKGLSTGKAGQEPLQVGVSAALSRGRPLTTGLARGIDCGDTNPSGFKVLTRFSQRAPSAGAALRVRGRPAPILGTRRPLRVRWPRSVMPDKRRSSCGIASGTTRRSLMAMS
jgi:hypothetical protein